MPRRWLRVTAAVAALVTLSWGMTRVVAAWRYQAGLDWARREIALGRYSAARDWLAVRPAPPAGDGEAAYLLGFCERAGGQNDRAAAAWQRVPPSSPFATRAALALTRTLVGDLGRYADAERVLESALRAATGPEETEVRHALSQLYFQEGRRDAMRRLTRAGWKRAPRPSVELRDLWMIDNATTQISTVSADIEEAGNRAPGDDRVWLAKANLATLTGRLTEAARLLDRCLGRRPDDPAVWRARLDHAQAAGDDAEARRALAHLPADTLGDAEVESVRAWLADRRGDRDAQRAALQRLLELDPGETRALERLAALAWEAGRTEQANAYRVRKAELDRSKERLLRLLEKGPPSGGYAELARLSEGTGRTFDAIGWWTLAAWSRPNDRDAPEALARLRGQRVPTAPRPAGETLAVRLGIGAGRPSAAAAAPGGVREAAGAVPSFREAAARVGLRFTYENGRSPLRQLPETTSGGVGVLDFDGDGWYDVYCVQGGPFPPAPGRLGTGDRLFRNRGDGTFEDATVRSGLAAMARGYGHGVAVGDVDNDGRPDILVTRWNAYALYHNRGDGTFEDATARSGLAGARDWPTSAAFADLDGDGDLDLYVCHYLAWDAEHPQLCDRAVLSGERPDPQRRYDYCMPNPLPALPDHLFRNDAGRFVDVTDEAGIIDKNGRGLGVVAADLDGDGKTDLFVANDTTANYLFRNLGGMKFEEVGVSAGVASNAEGAFQAGMGTALGDLDGDGLPDLVVTNFYGEATTYYRNLGRGMFGDQTVASGLAAASRFRLGFGVALPDVNNDGRLDLATACGHVVDNRPDYPYAMKSQLLTGNGSGRLADVTDAAGPPWTEPKVARGLAASDLDHDGRVDVLIVPQGEPLLFAENRTRGGHFVSFTLEGTASNRDAVGAAVTVVAGGKRQTAWRSGGGSYQSAGDPRLHFGLGGGVKVDAVEVRWPSGKTGRFTDLPADRGYRLREGESQAQPLKVYGPTTGAPGAPAVTTAAGPGARP